MNNWPMENKDKKYERLLDEILRLQQENQELKAQNYRLAGILLRYKDYIEDGMNQVFIEKLVNKYSSKQSLAAIKAEALQEIASKLTCDPCTIVASEYADNLLKDSEQ